MIKIGDFARLGRVSIVTLRHYDEVGLLKPAIVDRFTGYRHYSAGQLLLLNRILALKDLGLSLEQIGRILAGGLSVEQLRGMLMLKRAEVEERLGEEQERLMRINARLRQLEREETMPNYEVVLKSVPAMLVASRRVTIPTNDQVPEYLMPAFSEASAHAQQQGAKETGPCLAVWHTPSDVHTNEVAEGAIPVDRKVPSSDRVQVYELPAAQVASVVHQGDFDEFTQGHTAALLWIEANGYRVDGPYREVYIKTEPADSITEIQYPVARA